nr:MAG TPA: hypothetical protein [Caudoviricetes sp.]DAM18742.1 MAG TPA: hypothetical protein [Caudoviricetes sp.]DAV41497.1 MAG TPA: hypothetical protein [Caudoviricetes sp.]
MQYRKPKSRVSICVYLSLDVKVFHTKVVLWHAVISI